MRLASSLADRRSRCAWFPALALALAAPFAAASAASAPDEMAELLRRSDVAANEPASFRSRILLQGPGQEAPSRSRSGASARRGRSCASWARSTAASTCSTSRRGSSSSHPGRASPSSCPARSACTAPPRSTTCSGLRYSRDFSIARAEPSRGRRAGRVRAPGARRQGPVPARALRRRARGRRDPTRAELRLKGGKLATTVEFAAWSPGVPPRPLRLVLRDHLRGGAETRVELLELEERSVPEGLFSLSDGTARRRLEEQERRHA